MSLRLKNNFLPDFWSYGGIQEPDLSYGRIWPNTRARIPEPDRDAIYPIAYRLKIALG